MLWCSLLLISTTIFGQTGGATFENGPLMNRARIVPLATTLSNGNIAIFGGREFGFVSSYYTDIYDPVAKTFTELNMAVPRDNAALVTLTDGRYLLVGGGYDWGIPAYATNEIFDPSDNSFTMASTMGYSRMQPAAAQLNNGHVLIVGGWYDDYAAINTEIYDIEDNLYTVSGSLNAPRSQAMVIPTTDGGAIVAGGYTTYGASMITTVEYYNVETGSFSIASDEIIPTDPGWTMWGRTRAIVDDKMNNGKYVFLAYRSSPEVEYALVYFDPATKTFEKKFSFVLSEHPTISGGIYDMILDKNGNYVYLLATVSGSDPVQVALISVDLTNEMVYIPENNYVMPAGEYLFPSLAFIPSTGEILITGVSATPSDYFNATNITYLLKPEHSVGIEEEMILPNAITCFPNPTTGAFNIKINVPIEGELILSVFDIDGRELCNLNMHNIQQSSNLYSLNNLDLGSGMYIIKIRNSNNTVYTTTLVVTK
jgi:hypothetical protein